MELKPETIKVDNKEYQILIEKRYMRSLTMRLSKDGKSLIVHAPYFVTKRNIMAFVYDKAPSLIKKSEKRKSSIPENMTPIFGELVEGTIDEKTKKSLLLEYCVSAQREYEKMMNIPPYNVKVRTMSSRYGVNSKKTNTITYTTELVGYSKEIINAIIVHELSHHFERNHQKGFYDIVYKYCPNYKELHKKLRKGEIK